MEDTAKYLIHADLVADGVVERSDVVGAAFGQTEGLLGDGLDIRDLQDSAKLGRIDVSVDSEGGQSFGHITIASSLDRVETATLAAALEAIERIGPCRARVEVQRIEDVRAAKRREVVDRAKELLSTAFDEGAIDSDDILEEVRESVRIEDITEYEGYPAGPHVETSDAVVVVEGRADVVNLLQYGIKNAVAVEGTNVPDEIAALTHERTVTAFLDGDRGGDLIRQELQQVGDVDFVARAPRGESVEDLSRAAVDAALRGKKPASVAGDDGDGEGPLDPADPVTDGAADAEQPASETEQAPGDDEATAATDGSATPAPATGGTASPDPAAKTLADHVAEVVGAGTARMLDEELRVLQETEAADAFDALEDAKTVPRFLVVDATVTQRLLDLAAQRGVGTLVGPDSGEFVKQPASVRVHTADQY
ncbi:DNA primase DnaG [Halobacterium wangiae]|uniref:DNA primase DnaG n=1 Tax=Halobacterium wangiae TaxID=2902623 RepID=UPI001E4B327F|nr:DNA primase DnaG [Halobacterium wangiae]